MNNLLTQVHDLPAGSPQGAPGSQPLISGVVGSVAGGGKPAGAGTGGRRGLVFATGFVLGIATIEALLGRR